MGVLMPASERPVETFLDLKEQRQRLLMDAYDEAILRELTPPETPSRLYDQAFVEDPAVWLAQTRMSQTEVGLRLGRFLLESPIIDSNVVVPLSGYELTRTERPQFPVTRYLTERLGFAPKVNRPYKWRGHYSLPGVERRLVVTFDVHGGHVSARLTTGNRLIIFVSAGPTASRRGSSEHRMLHAAIGRAVVWEGARPTDHIAVCVPRSGGFRKAIAEFRRADLVQRLGLLLLTVDRHTGVVGGSFEELESACRGG